MNQPNFFDGLGMKELMNKLDNITTCMQNRLDPGNPPGLTVGSSTTTDIKIANTTKYSSKGVPKSKSTAEAAFPTSGNSTYTGADDVTPNANSVQERVYMITLDGSGNVGIVAGTQTTGANTAPYPEWPSTVVTNTDADGNVTYQNRLYTPGVTPIGSLRITVAAGTSGFRANTTSPTTSGAITATYQDGYPMPYFDPSLNPLQDSNGNYYQ